MAEIGAFEAKANFSRLLARAKRREEITITHRGRPIAKLVPCGVEPNSPAAWAAVRRIREAARKRGAGNITPEEIKEWIEEGRR